MKGLVHINTGDGKGKTTAAIGLAVRAAGAGKKVLFVQFFKPEKDQSGEKDAIRERFEGSIELLRASFRHPFFTGEKTNREALGREARKFLSLVKERLGEGFGLLVLDEAAGLINEGLVTEDEFAAFLDSRPDELDVVITGRDASPGLVRRADYVTEMLKIKHPFDNGIKARKGIDF